MTNARADAKQEMSELIKRQTDVSIALANLEKQIYNFETTYLEEAMEHGGNVIRGFGKLLESVNGSAGGSLSAAASSSFSSNFSSSVNAKQKKALKQKLEEMDRVFSLSSVTSPVSSRLLELGIGIASSTTEGNSPNGLSRENFLTNGDKSVGGRPPHSARVPPQHQSSRKELSQEEQMLMAAAAAAEDQQLLTSDDDEEEEDEDKGTPEIVVAPRRGPPLKRRRQTFVEH